MRIAVCIKQVPVLAKLELDPETKTLRRDGVPTEVSAFDVRAVVKAIEIRDAHGGEVVVVTMGPEQASEALDYCLALGADRALHLCDAAFAGSDALATSRVLACALARERPDLILLGRHSVDAETSQVGPTVAELLDLPQITQAHTLEVSADGQIAQAERETDGGFETVRCPLPVVVTVAEDIAPERFPRRADREAASARPRARITAAALGLDRNAVGAAGSPTWVAGLRPVVADRLGQVVEGENPAAAARELVRILVERHGLFSEWNVPAQATASTDGPAVTREGSSDFWAVVEVNEGEIRPVSFEMIARLRALADRIAGRVSAIVLRPLGEKGTRALAAAGADVIYAVGDVDVQGSVRCCTATLTQAVADRHPGLLVFPATSFGRDVAPRLAARLGLGLTSDCVDLTFAEDGRLEQHKPAFGGAVIAPIRSRTTPEMATIRPGVLPLPTLDDSRAVCVQALVVGDVGRAADPDRVGHRSAGDAAAALDHADIVLGVGMGMGSVDALERLQPLLDILPATLCATRDVTDAGWLPRQYQVGLTGRSIAPKLYFGLGIRGAYEHMVGLRRAGIIVVVNKNAKAMAFRHSDYGIVGSVEDVVPALMDALAAARGDCR